MTFINYIAAGHKNIAVGKLYQVKHTPEKVVLSVNI